MPPLPCPARGTHRSVNAGWQEAPVAGALGLALAGPRRYGDTIVDDAWMGDGRRSATVRDIRQALRLYLTACGMACWSRFWVSLVIGP